MDLPIEFNGDVNFWNKENNYETNNSDRITKFHEINYKLNDINLCQIEALERIGSDSTMGEVYKYDIEDENIAIKILPIINSRSEKINQNEITLAKQVSQLVLENKSKYFPIVYYDIFCNSTFYYEHSNSKFAIQSLNYQYYLYLKEMFKNEPDIVKNIDSYYKAGKNIIEYIESQLIENNSLLINELFSINSQLLFSELAYTDLRHYLTKRISKEILNIIVLQVLEGIRDLQIYCNIVHNDLHLGNILLLYNPEKEINIMIHDFGRSKSITKLSLINLKTDIRTFLLEIKKYVDIYLDDEIYNYFIKKIQNIVEMLDNENMNPVLLAIMLWKDFTY